MRLPLLQRPRAPLAPGSQELFSLGEHIAVSYKLAIRDKLAWGDICLLL